MATVAAGPRALHKTKKKFTRPAKDDSQLLRRAFQLAFLALNVWIGLEFYGFVRYHETGAGWPIARPPGVEGWLPIASLMNLKVLIETGALPRVHPAGLFLLIAFIAISWLLRKAFCSWLCPVGTVSEYLWRLGQRTFGRNLRPPKWLDMALRSLKYILLGLFQYAVLSMPVPAIRAFLEGPYGLVADVKMLNSFRFLSAGAAITLGILLIGSVFIKNLWCRYLCPYGALFCFFSMLSPMKIRREPAACIDCAKCAKACPALLPVDKLIAIRSVECTGCLECVAVCPAAGALAMKVTRKRGVRAWALAAAAAILFLGVCGYARWSGHWHTYLPANIYSDLVRRAHEFTHP